MRTFSWITSVLFLIALVAPAPAFPSSNCADVVRDPGAPDGPLPEVLDFVVSPDPDFDD